MLRTASVAEGIVVCSLDTNKYSAEYPKSEWGYLRKGALIDSPQAGLIHYINPRTKNGITSAQLKSYLAKGGAI